MIVQSRRLSFSALLAILIASVFAWYGNIYLAYPVTQVALSTSLDIISGVTGKVWKANKFRTFTYALIFGYERDSQNPPVVRDGKDIDAWFRVKDHEGSGSATTKKAQDFTCHSDKWVVVTTIFGPTKLAHQLERLPGWCTVVVADQRTPVEEWAAGKFTRVKLLTLEEQARLPFRILELIPFDHFGRKNIGYLYAIRAGARYIYDTDDDNILKTDGEGNPVGIPTVDARQPGHFVAQAWHCDFSEADTRTWNPYAVYGQPTAWPRGLPLDDIRATSEPCGHAAAAAEMGNHAAEANATHAPYTYHTVFHRLPGITFPIQQSLADVHPDVDAIYRLTRYPPTFSFDVALTNAAGVYGPDQVYAPYNAQATLHHHAAFWAMLLPVTVHGRVSDIWRSYVAQRLMEKYGMRVAFMKPWVDQERTAHDYLRDFDSEQPLYLRAGGVVDFLRDWQPSRADLTLAAEQEELVVALYEHGVVEEQDVLLTQAWLQDLRAISYVFPDARMRFYDAWRQQQFLGGLVILSDEHTKGSDLRTILPVVNGQLDMFADRAYPVMVFYIDNGEADGWMSDTMKEDLRRLAPNLRLELYGTQYTWPRGDGYGLNGFMYCSQFLSYEIYRHPAVWRLQYLFRVDEDVTSFAGRGQAIALDLFEHISANSLDVVGFQKSNEPRRVMQHLCPRSHTYFAALNDTDGWHRVEQRFCSTRNLVAGFIELYNLRKTFLNASYFDYIESIDFLQGIYKFNWREQSFKTVWLNALSSNSTYRYMRNELPSLKHKGQDW